MAFDLRCGWDLNRSDHRACVWRYLEQERPLLIVGSPERRAFSALQSLTSGSPNYRATLREGLNRLRFMMDIYSWQIRRGGWFLHEQPWPSCSWNLDMVTTISSRPDVMTARCDQCMFGQWTWGPDNCMKFARKATGPMTHCQEN